MATNSKMFVHYSGTKASFIAAGLASQYTNKIVFIKGGENGTGACVYTHGAYYANVEEALAALKYFSKISANGVTAEASAPNGAINFSADDPASVEVKVDSNGVHFGLTEEFKAAVNVTLPKRIKDIEDDYLTSEDKQGLEQGIADALTEAKGYTDSEVARIVADSGSGLIGQEGDASSADTIYGAKKYAEEKAAAAEAAAKSYADGLASNYDAAGSAAAAEAAAKSYADGLAENYDAAGSAAAAEAAAKSHAEEKATDAETAAKSYADEKAAAVQGKLDEEIARAKAAEEANAGAIATEKGRLDAFLASAEVGEKAIDTLKEIQDYITTDGAAAEAMTAAIAAAQGAADKAQGEVDSLETVVAEEVTRAKAAEEANAAAVVTEKERAENAESGLNTRLAAVEADYLKAADKTELQGAIDDVIAEHAADEKVTAEALTDLNTKYNQLSEDYVAADATTLASAKTYTGEEIAKLNVTDAAVDNQFVTEVSETAGKISVKRSGINASQITSDFSTKSTTVQAALSELASYWEWEEI